MEAIRPLRLGRFATRLDAVNDVGCVTDDAGHEVALGTDGLKGRTAGTAVFGAEIDARSVAFATRGDANPLPDPPRGRFALRYSEAEAESGGVDRTLVAFPQGSHEGELRMNREPALDPEVEP